MDRLQAGHVPDHMVVEQDAAAAEQVPRVDGDQPGLTRIAWASACPADPMTAGTDDIAELASTFTTIGGKAVHNLGKRLSH